MLEQARAGLDRLTPEQAAASVAADGSALVDIRGEAQIAADGRIAGAMAIERNVLEWRLEPGGAHAIPELARPGRRIILICDEGYQSSLAAASLRRLGLDATDVIGGYRAWRAAGLG
jgi:rhodanese-related sulfurtransferase